MWKQTTINLVRNLSASYSKNNFSKKICEMREVAICFPKDTNTQIAGKLKTNCPSLLRN